MTDVLCQSRLHPLVSPEDQLSATPDRPAELTTASEGLIAALLSLPASAALIRAVPCDKAGFVGLDSRTYPAGGIGTSSALLAGDLSVARIGKQWLHRLFAGLQEGKLNNGSTI